MLVLLWNLVNALAEEPFFNGNLLVGFTGGVVLNSLLVLDPAAFASLTTLGSPALKTDSLASRTAGVAITIVRQLYVAILIAGILGKPRQRAADRRSAHLQRRTASRSSKLKRQRR